MWGESALFRVTYLTPYIHKYISCFSGWSNGDWLSGYIPKGGKRNWSNMISSSIQAHSTSSASSPYRRECPKNWKTRNLQNNRLQLIYTPKAKHMNDSLGIIKSAHSRVSSLPMRISRWTFVAWNAGICGFYTHDISERKWLASNGADNAHVPRASSPSTTSQEHVDHIRSSK